MRRLRYWGVAFELTILAIAIDPKQTFRIALCGFGHRHVQLGATQVETDIAG